MPIARSAIQRNSFATLAHPMLEELSRTFGVTTIATQLVQDREMVVVALCLAQLPFRLSTELGSRFPALTSATGRCVAAFADDDEAPLRRRFEQLKWDNPPEFDTWKTQIDETRRDGYGIDRGEFIGGVTIIAAPFFNAVGAVGRSLVAMGTSEKMESTGVALIAEQALRMRDHIAGYLISE